MHNMVQLPFFTPQDPITNHTLFSPWQPLPFNQGHPMFAPTMNQNPIPFMNQSPTLMDIPPMKLLEPQEPRIP